MLSCIKQKRILPVHFFLDNTASKITMIIADITNRMAANAVRKFMLVLHAGLSYPKGRMYGEN